MNYLKLLLSNIWVRIFGLIFSAILFLILFNILINSFIISPLETDVSNSKRGVSRYQVELSRLEKEISSIQSKISKKSKNSKAQYDHYYSLYSNPVRYINKFVLSDAKPNGLLIISSSVVPNVTFTSIDRARFKPFLKEYGINNDRNLPKFFRVFSVTLSATGSFPAIGEYLSNLYSLPAKFSITLFDLKETNNSLVLNLKMSFFIYNMNES